MSYRIKNGIYNKLLMRIVNEFNSLLASHSILNTCIINRSFYQYSIQEISYTNTFHIRNIFT